MFLPPPCFWLEPVNIAAVVVFVIDLIGNTLSISTRFLNAGVECSCSFSGRSCTSVTATSPCRSARHRVQQLLLNAERTTLLGAAARAARGAHVAKSNLASAASVQVPISSHQSPSGGHPTSSIAASVL
jgi:hypothetical protein